MSNASENARRLVTGDIDGIAAWLTQVRKAVNDLCDELGAERIANAEQRCACGNTMTTAVGTELKFEVARLTAERDAALAEVERLERYMNAEPGTDHGNCALRPLHDLFPYLSCCGRTLAQKTATRLVDAEAESEQRRHRAARAVELLRKEFTLRADCKLVDEAAEDTCAEVGKLRVQLELARKKS